jgi:hypothetical protein
MVSYNICSIATTCCCSVLVVCVTGTWLSTGEGCQFIWHVSKIEESICSISNKCESKHSIIPHVL